VDIKFNTFVACCASCTVCCKTQNPLLCAIKLSDEYTAAIRTESLSCFLSVPSYPFFFFVLSFNVLETSTHQNVGAVLVTCTSGGWIGKLDRG